MSPEAAEKAVMWYKSAIVTLLILAEAESSPLNNQQVIAICKHILAKEPEKD